MNNSKDVTFDIQLELKKANEKIQILSKFETLLAKIFSEYSDKFGEHTKEEYNKLRHHFDKVFHSSGSPKHNRRNSRETSQLSQSLVTSAKSLTFAKTLNTYRVYDPKANKYEIKYRNWPLVVTTGPKQSTVKGVETTVNQKSIELKTTSSRCQPTEVTPKECPISAVSPVSDSKTLSGKKLEKYRVYDPNTKTIKFIWGEVKAPSSQSKEDSGHKDVKQINRRNVVFKALSQTTTPSSSTKPICDVIDLTEDNGNNEKKTANEKQKTSALSVGSKSHSNVSQVIDIKSMGRSQTHIKSCVGCTHKPKTVPQNKPNHETPHPLPNPMPMTLANDRNTIIVDKFTSKNLRTSRFSAPTRVIDSMGRVFEINWVRERFKYFNYETQTMEYRWTTRQVTKPIIATFRQQTGIPVEQSNDESSETTKVVPKEMEEPNDKTNEKTTESVERESLSSNLTVYTHKKPKRIHSALYSDQFLDPITKRYVCSDEDCGKSYPTYNSLCSHRKLCHKKLEFFCETDNCGKGFTCQWMLNKHMKTHTQNYGFNCDLCDYKTRVKSALKYHIQKKHSKQKFKCDSYKCKRSFLTETDLKRHKKEHRPEPSFFCSRKGCGERFYTYPQLYKHKNDVHKSFIYCDWPGCEYKNKNNHLMKEHRRIHTGEKPFECDWPECGKRFRTMSNLKLHLKVHQKRS